jgi:putative FmdB family regulatory protein
MPTYSYRCKSCSHEFDELQKITDEALVQCPACGKNALVRIIGGGVGLVFKGSGFYLTDYKNKKTSPAAEKPPPKKDSKDPPKPEAKSSEPGVAKPTGE